MMREKEMFVCPRPFCTSILLSLSQLEDHIRAEHGRQARSNNYIEQQFSFDQVQEDQQDDIQERVEEEVEEAEFEFEFEFEPNSQEPEQVQEEKRDDVTTTVEGDKLKSLIDNMKAKRGRKEKRENKIKEKKVKLKKVTTNNIIFRQVKSETFIRKSKSSFTMEDIEKRFDNLAGKDRAEFRVLMAEGRDEEIYRKIFGDFNRNRNWICIFHKNGTFQGNRRAFEKHFQADHGERIIYTCELCQKSIKSFFLFTEHLRETHYKETQCDACNLSYSTASKLLTHLLKVHGSGGIPCGLCDKRLATKQYLKAHQAANHSSVKFPCSSCSKEFKTKKSVETHEKIHSRLPKVKRELKMRTCEDCGQVLRTTKFSLHKKSHQKHESLQCKKCEKFFYSPNAMKRHVKAVHEKIREYSCKDCMFSANTRWHLQHHLSKVHLNILDTCNICQVKVRSEYHHVIGSHKNQIAWKDYVQHKKRIKDEIPASFKEEEVSC